MSLTARLLVLLATAGTLAGAGRAAAAAASTAPLAVVAVSPRPGATRLPGTAAVVVSFSERLAPSTPLPSWSVGVAGTWTRLQDRLVFRPTGAFPPDTRLTLTVPGGPGGTRALHGATLTRRVTASFRTGGGSLLGAQEILAALDYLPARVLPARSTAVPATGAAGRLDTPAALARALYAPPGRLVAATWAPPALRSLLQPGVDGVLTRGALVSFQRVNDLPLTGQLDPATLRRLARDAAAPGRNRQPGGYTYALVDQRPPETLTVFDDGRAVVRTPANTGIPASPTADGSFLVYERLASQVMTGTTPWGTHYADPVAWVAYFNGGDAVHYIARAAYGYPQSLGCVETPYAAAKAAWPYLRLGTVVTVEG